MNDELLQQILEAINGTNERLDNLQIIVEGMGKSDEGGSDTEQAAVVEEPVSKVEESLQNIESGVNQINGVLADGGQKTETVATEVDYTKSISDVHNGVLFGNTLLLSITVVLGLLFGLQIARIVWRKM